MYIKWCPLFVKLYFVNCNLTKIIPGYESLKYKHIFFEYKKLK